MKQKKTFHLSLRRTWQLMTGGLSVVTLAALCWALCLSATLPDRYYLAKGSRFSLGDSSLIQTSSNDGYPLSVYSSTGNTFRMDLKLLGLINIKPVSVQVVDRRVVALCGTPFGIKMVTDGVMVIGTGAVTDCNSRAVSPAQTAGIQEGDIILALCGTPFGIKMVTDGVMVIGTGAVTDCNSRAVSPAQTAGIQEGDIILSINGEKISSKKQLTKLVESSAGQPLSLVVRRGEQLTSLHLSPVRSSLDNSYHLGLWVRDSSAGIGTMTFYDPNNGCFAGLGHAICDVDTGQLMPLSQGEIVEASIIGVHAGKSGSPGQLQGAFVANRSIGSLYTNSYNGVYGRLMNQPVDALIGVHAGKSGSPGQLQGAFVANRSIGSLYTNSYNGVYGRLMNQPVDAQTIPMAQCQEVRQGPVKILTTVSGQKPQLFDACIEKLSLSQDEPTKNMVLRITDPDLLELSGGIVQGMSGSPIIQDGMLVGAVTHQDEPTKNMVLRITDPDLLELSGGIVQGMSGSPIIQDGMLVGAVTHV